MVALVATIALVVAAATFTIVATRDGEGEPAGAGSWEKVPFEKTGFERDADVTSMTRSGHRVVAVGYRMSLGAEASPPDGLFTGSVWTSVDGRRWKSVASDQFEGTILELVIDTPKGLLAFGRRPRSGEQMSVWRSSDAKRWERLTDQAPVLTRVVVGGPGLVAAGGIPDEEGDGMRTAIWTSRDGSEWERVAGGEQRFPSGSVTGLARNDDAFIAVGLEFELVLPDDIEDFNDVAPLETDLLLWTSPDGVHWKRVHDPKGLPDTAGSSPPVVVGDDGFLVFAPTEVPPTTTTTTTTTTTPAGQDGDDSTVVLCAVGPGVDAAFESNDGTRWTRRTRRDLPFGSASRVVATHDRLLVAATEGTCESSRTVVYLSEDGRRWDLAVEDPPTKGGESFRSPEAASATKRGAVVLVGDFGPLQTEDRGPDAWVWTAP